MAINNTVTLIGNMGSEARIEKSNKDGSEFAAVSIATTDSYKDDNEQWHEKETVWHSVVAFSPKVIEVLKSLKKGTRVQITGSLSYRPYDVTNGDGEVITKKELEILNEAASGNYVLGESDQEGLNYLNSLFVKWNLHPLNISFSKEEPNEVVKLKADSISDARYWAVKILSKVSLGIYELTEKNKQDLRSLNEILIKWNYEPLEIDF